MERKLSSMEKEILINEFGNTFYMRRDIFPSQLPDGRYVLVREPLTDRHLELHLAGHITLGTYLLDQESRGRLMVLDADTVEGFTMLKNTSAVLSKEGVPSYLELSRRGGHQWFYLAEKKSGSEIRAFGQGIEQHFQLTKLELFPKQDVLKEGPGSLIRSPFGIHRASGQRYPFIDPNGELLAPTVQAQIRLLADPKTVPEALFAYYQRLAPTEAPTTSQKTETGSDIFERIKAKAPAVDFIGAFVPLKRNASGAVGKCPFHDDEHESFGVNQEGNYWNCFAGCGGGSIIDFWMKWRGIELGVAITELKTMLGVEE